MEPEVLARSVHIPDGLERVEGSRLDPMRPEDVLGIVDLQQRPGRDQCREMGVLEFRQEIRSLLLPIADIARPEVLEAGHERRVARYGHGRADSLVQCAQQDRLPAASRQPGHADSVAIDRGVLVQVVEPLLHRHVEETNPVRTRQVQVGTEPVLVFRVCELAEVEPVQVERVNALPGLVDATLLLVLDFLAPAVDVTVHVEHGRCGCLRSFWFVQQRRHVQSRNDFEAQLADPVSFGAAGHKSSVLRGKGPIHPFAGPAAEDGLQDPLADPGRLARPLLSALRAGRIWYAVHEVPAQLVLDDLFRDQLRFKQRPNLRSVRLGRGWGAEQEG